MKKIMILLCAGILFQACTPEDAFTLLDNLGFLYDARDHNVYKTVTIGRQTWMAQNLAYLPTVTGQDKKSTSIPCYYVYGYSGTDVQEAKKNPNYKTFGVLYNWPAANIACPEGWRLPDDADWKQLEAYLVYHGYCYDGSIDIENQKVAKSMAAEKEWQPSPVEGAVGNNDYPEMRNKSGFSALPAGFYSFYKEFKRKGTDTFGGAQLFLSSPWLVPGIYLTILKNYIDTWIRQTTVFQFVVLKNNSIMEWVFGIFSGIAGSGLLIGILEIIMVLIALFSYFNFTKQWK